MPASARNEVRKAAAAISAHASAVGVGNMTGQSVILTVRPASLAVSEAFIGGDVDYRLRSIGFPGSLQHIDRTSHIRGKRFD
jgi:hypothetical protein